MGFEIDSFDLLSEIWNELSSIKSKIAANASNITDSVEHAIENTLTAVKDDVNEKIDTVKNVIGDVKREVTDTVNTLASSIGSVTSEVKAAVKSAITTASEKITEVKTILSSEMAKVQRDLERRFAEIGEVVGSVFTRATDIIGNAITLTLESVTATLRDIIERTTQLLEGVSVMLSKVFTDVVTRLEEMMAGLSEVLYDAIDYLIEAVAKKTTLSDVQLKSLIEEIRSTYNMITEVLVSES